MTGDASSPRATARRLTDLLASSDPRLVRLAGVNLAPALEQQLYFAIRDARRPSSGIASRAVAAAGSFLRPAAAAAAGGIGAWRTPSPGEHPLVVLVREATHYPVIELIERQLQELAGESVAIVRVGRATGVAPAHAIAPRLSDLVLPSRGVGLLAYEARVRRSMSGATRGWDGLVGDVRAAELRRIAVKELGRISLGAVGLLSLLERWRPALVAAFDEVGTWARLLPEVARTKGVPSLDLPHAEAADADAIQGVAYDRMAVYGPRARDVLNRAGVADDRIVEIGAPRLDPLIQTVRDRHETPDAGRTRRVVFAAQYVSGAMEPWVMDACYAAALAAARAVSADELVVAPHPAEVAGTAAALVGRQADSNGVVVRQGAPGQLHQDLLDAWLLVTGWSNSVFEAAVSGVPAIAVNPSGVAPVDFAAEGLALPAADAESAAAAAASLLVAQRRAAVLARAREVAAERLGRLDGGASRRAAELMLEMARAGVGRAA